MSVEMLCQSGLPNLNLFRFQGSIASIQKRFAVGQQGCIKHNNAWMWEYFTPAISQCGYLKCSMKKGSHAFPVSRTLLTSNLKILTRKIELHGLRPGKVPSSEDILNRLSK